MRSWVYRDCPCKDCVAPKRHPGCHGNCEDKRAWDEKVAKKKGQIEAEMAKDRQVECFKMDSVRQTIRRANRKNNGSNL